MNSRTASVLDRFPRHLDADGRGKVLGLVVDTLAGGFDVQASQVGRVRRAHKIRVVDETRDLDLLADLHDLSSAHFDLLGRRMAALRGVLATISDPSADVAATEAAEAELSALIGLAPGAFSPFPNEGADPAPARKRLAAALRDLVGFPSELNLSRRLVLDVIGCHRAGNGSVTSILSAAATYLHLSIEGEVVHSADRFWHVAHGRDRLRLVRPEPPETSPPTTIVTPIADVVAIEENPFRAHEVFASPRRHGERFSVFRRGWDEVVVTVVVQGVEDRTVGPIVVNLDTGAGVVYPGLVPTGSELRFIRDGRVQLDGADVAGSSFSFRGAVFADAGATHHNDFVWAMPAPPTAPEPGSRSAAFAVTGPIADAFEETAAFPHSAGRLDSPTMSTGESRWAFFVAEATYAGEASGGTPRPAAPRYRAGRFDVTVFATDSGILPPAGQVGFEWQEHEPFAVRLWIPMRFAAIDTEGVLQVREHIRLLLERHRPAGVHLYVDYADDRWTLGEGILRPPESTEADGVVVAGTRLWPHPSPPSGPST